jgi:hypothetical protein
MNFLETTFGKGYIAPMDYAALLIIIMVSVIIAMGIYRVFISGWVNGFRHPLNLRLLTISLALTLIGGIGFIYIRKVLLIELTFNELWLPPIILGSIWIVFAVVLSLFGKKLAK